jgi:hypothetical protein
MISTRRPSIPQRSNGFRCEKVYFFALCRRGSQDSRKSLLSPETAVADSRFRAAF